MVLRTSAENLPPPPLAVMITKLMEPLVTTHPLVTSHFCPSILELTLIQMKVTGITASLPTTLSPTEEEEEDGWSTTLQK